LQGLEMRGREASPQEVKKAFSGMSIEHQFQRRHQSCPPETLTREVRFSDMFEHMLKAEAYACLLDRPEGTLRQSSQRKPLPVLSLPRSMSARPGRLMKQSNEVTVSPGYSPRATQSVQGEDSGELLSEVGHHNEASDESCESDVPAGPSTRQEVHVPSLPVQSAQLISALREATKNMPAEAVWDAMLKLLAESPEISPNVSTRGTLDDAEPSLPAKVAAAVAAGSAGSSAPGSRLPSPRSRHYAPAKKHGSSQRSGSQDGHRRCSPRRRAGMSRQASDVSIYSATTADTMAGPLSLPPNVKDGFGSSQSQTSSSVSLRSSLESINMRAQTNSRRSCDINNWLLEERRKARLRAAWVA